jgi:hypothetical protein
LICRFDVGGEEHKAMINGEKLLWQAILEIAICDVLQARSPQELRDHLDWFRDDSPHFQMACEFTDSDPETVRNLLITLLKNGDENDIKTFVKSTKCNTRGKKMKK